MKNKQKISFVILGIMIGLAIGVFFVKSDRKKHADEFQKEKTALLEKAKQKELALCYTIDSLKAEIVYLKSEKILENAKSLEDLGGVAKMLHFEWTDFDAYGLNRKLHPDLFHKLWTLGQKFFASEVRTISSQKELEIFEERYKLVGYIVPIYSMDLSGETFSIYYEKIAKFRGQR